VAGDIRHFGLSEDQMPALYFPAAQEPPNEVSLLLHTDRNPLALTGRVREVIQEVDPDEPISSFTTMDQLFSHSIASPWFRSLLLSVFGGLALLLAWVGVYSVISCTVVQRTHEFGIRMALGAGRNDILRIITAYGLRLAALGLGAGLAGAFVLARLASSFLYSVRTDPWAFLLGSAALLAVVLLASHLPARRATRVDPMVALRQE
jgi:putative ABC transport system permease protein